MHRRLGVCRLVHVLCGCHQRVAEQWAGHGRRLGAQLAAQQRGGGAGAFGVHALLGVHLHQLVDHRLEHRRRKASAVGCEGCCGFALCRAAPQAGRCAAGAPEPGCCGGGSLVFSCGGGGGVAGAAVVEDGGDVGTVADGGHRQGDARPADVGADDHVTGRVKDDPQGDNRQQGAHDRRSNVACACFRDLDTDRQVRAVNHPRPARGPGRQGRLGRRPWRLGRGGDEQDLLRCGRHGRDQRQRVDPRLPQPRRHGGRRG